MKFFKYLILFLFFCINVSVSQNCDTNSIKNLCAESKKQLKINVSQSYILALKAHALAKQCPNTIYYYESIISLSKAYCQKSEADSCIKLLLPILSNYSGSMPTIYKAGVFHQLSSAYTMNMKLVDGLKNGLEALKNYEIIKDTSNTANLLVNIANIYQQQNNFKQAENYLRQAETKAKLITRKVALGNVYNTMGILYAEHGQLDSALKFF